MEEIENVRNGRYTLRGKLTFDTNKTMIEMEAKEALEIAFTLFNWARMPYDVLEELKEKMKE